MPALNSDTESQIPAQGFAGDPTQVGGGDAAPGTPHAKATCCWCGGPLVVATVEGLRCWLCPVDYPRQIDGALFATLKGQKKTCVWVPLPSQATVDACPARNILWGGQAGPGKSTGARRWLYKRSLTVPGHEALLLRENWEQLDKTHLRGMEREVELLGGKFWKGDRKAEFGKGSDASVIDCGHMADTDSVTRYLSTEYGAIVPDEASLYPVDTEGTTPLAELSTRARREYTEMYGPHGERVKAKTTPKFMPVTNPGGPSAAWLRDMFIDHEPDFEKFPALKPVCDEAGQVVKGYDATQWVYLPAKLTDNPYMRDNYAETDLAVLTATRYKQLAEGDWRAFSGQFFQEWDEQVHVRSLVA